MLTSVNEEHAADALYKKLGKQRFSSSIVSVYYGFSALALVKFEPNKMDAYMFRKADISKQTGKSLQCNNRYFFPTWLIFFFQLLKLFVKNIRYFKFFIFEKEGKVQVPSGDLNNFEPLQRALFTEAFLFLLHSA